MLVLRQKRTFCFNNRHSEAKDVLDVLSSIDLPKLRKTDVSCSSDSGILNSSTASEFTGASQSFGTVPN